MTTPKLKIPVVFFPSGEVLGGWFSMTADGRADYEDHDAIRRSHGRTGGHDGFIQEGVIYAVPIKKPRAKKEQA